MKPFPEPISACRHCRHYSPEGRRGGQCDQLDALVHGDWKACPLAMPAFAPSWETVGTLKPGPGEMCPAMVDAASGRSPAPKKRTPKTKTPKTGVPVLSAVDRKHTVVAMPREVAVSVVSG